ncbi:hypothetical protein LIER_26084 [Lithospermum erythrorhizon]|uniref:Uncharacterized protein n=1 Tax=Lithospermum erythrorhizon TaxID=34254 RepID=A0AAV3R759_LITER
MVKTRGGTSGASKKGRGDRDTQPPQLVGVNEKGEPIPLQSIPPQPNQQAKIPAKKPKVLLLLWKDNVALEKPNPEHREQFQTEYSATDEGMGMHVPATGDDSGKNPITGSISTKRVASTEVLISPTGENRKGRNVDSQHAEVENIEE